MPFLLVGIGVDDMFVMCNAIDQVPYTKTSGERIWMALSHSGPAITITSLTNALAFAFGGTTSLEALKSFCLFACVCIVMLYLLVNTLFLAVVVWDTRRVEKQNKECCGACFCKEESIICCKGYFLSKMQRDFTKVPQSEAATAKAKAVYDKSDAATRASLNASTTEQMLARFFAPAVLSTPGRIVFAIIYLVWTGISIYGATQIRIHFDI